MEVREASVEYSVAADPRVPAGYKQTEVGVIPEDWRIATIDQISTVGRGRVISHKEIARSLNPIYPVYSSQTSSNGVMGYLDTFEFEGEYITWTTDGANAGTVFYRNGRFNCTNVCGTIKLKSDNHLFVAKALGRIAPAHVSRHLGNPKLMNDVMKRVRIPLPPTKAEQEAIAEALSDADALIESLEQLLAKKRHLKQGAMQQLLTGKKRLPGFEVKPGYKQTEAGEIPKDWSIKLLPDVCRFRGGKAHEQHISEHGDYVCVNSKFISTDGAVRKYCTANFCCANENDVLMVMSDLPNGRALAKAYLVERSDLYAVNQRVCALTPYSACPKFLFYILNRNPYFLKFDNGVSQTHLLNNVFAACSLPLPPTNAEQEAIATLLSDMDAELAALEAKLAKTRNLKQGMMQELLTGRIRLI